MYYRIWEIVWWILLVGGILSIWYGLIRVLPGDGQDERHGGWFMLFGMACLLFLPTESIITNTQKFFHWIVTGQ